MNSIFGEPRVLTAFTHDIPLAADGTYKLGLEELV